MSRWRVWSRPGDEESDGWRDVGPRGPLGRPRRWLTMEEWLARDDEFDRKRRDWLAHQEETVPSEDQRHS